MNADKESIHILQVKTAIQQTGYLREKRGYVKTRGVPMKPESDVTAHRNKAKLSDQPNDPLYPKQWYIVSGQEKKNEI